MARCVNVSNNGTLRISSTPVENCQSFIILNAVEWPSLSIWTMPSAAEAAAAWGAGFTIPVVVFVIAAACRQIIKMFDD